MATSYRYLFADLLTNQVLAELYLTGVQFTQQLNTSGTLSGNILLTDATEVNTNVINATIPGRTAVYVDRNGVLVWGGIIWHREYDSESQHIQITAREFLSYFERRKITSDLVFSNVDQLTVASSLVNYAQSVSNGNIGVIIPSATSAVNVSRTFYGYEYKTVYDAILDLSRGGSTGVGSFGFDFTISVAYDGSGNPIKTLNFGYPRLGTAYSSTSTTAPVFEFPAGNVISYSYPEDGSIAASIVYGIGSGSNEGKTLAVPATSSSTWFSAGWPVLEEVVSYLDVTDANLLTALAAGQLAATQYPPTTLKIVAPPYQDPQFGSYSIGDDVRVRISDDRFPNGLDSTYRLVALNVSPGEASGERVTLTLTLPTS